MFSSSLHSNDYLFVFPVLYNNYTSVRTQLCRQFCQILFNLKFVFQVGHDDSFENCSVLLVVFYARLDITWCKFYRNGNLITGSAGNEFYRGPAINFLNPDWSVGGKTETSSLNLHQIYSREICERNLHHLQKGIYRYPSQSLTKLVGTPPDLLFLLLDGILRGGEY